MSIYTLIDSIDAGEIVLPAIQRDFVWDENRIESLFDSIFRGYPIGIIMLWETYEPLQHRRFIKDAQPNRLHVFDDNRAGNRLRLVLDGQQRLNSIYIALRGTLNSKYFYFDVLSGADTDDASEHKFRFRFASPGEVEADNTAVMERAAGGHLDEGRRYYVRLDDLVSLDVASTVRRRREIDNALKLTEAESLLLETNIPLARDSLMSQSEILKTQVIDANLPANHPSRKSVFDVLEIFVRINSQGVRLTRSDLILSMIKLHWPDASEVMPSFIAEVNAKSSVQIDSDFVIRCAFAVAGLGTRLDFSLLRKRSNVEAVKKAFEATTNGIRSALDFAQTKARIGSTKLLKGLNTLVPFVFYLAGKPKHTFSKSEEENALRALYLIALSGVLAQHSDSRTGALIRDANLASATSFPYLEVVRFVRRKTWLEDASHRLFSGNLDLSLSLVQGRFGNSVLYPKHAPEVDHIFPRSMFPDHELVNDMGNFWILEQVDNRNKSDTHPREFLREVDDRVLKRALIDREALDGRKFRSFVENRRTAMVKHLQKATGIEDGHFSADEDA